MSGGKVKLFENFNFPERFDPMVLPGMRGEDRRSPTASHPNIFKGVKTGPKRDKTYQGSWLFFPIGDRKAPEEREYELASRSAYYSVITRLLLMDNAELDRIPKVRMVKERGSIKGIVVKFMETFASAFQMQRLDPVHRELCAKQYEASPELKKQFVEMLNESKFPALAEVAVVCRDKDFKTSNCGFVRDTCGRLWAARVDLELHGSSWDKNIYFETVDASGRIRYQQYALVARDAWKSKRWDLDIAVGAQYSTSKNWIGRKLYDPGEPKGSSYVDQFRPVLPEFKKNQTAFYQKYAIVLFRILMVSWVSWLREVASTFCADPIMAEGLVDKDFCFIKDLFQAAVQHSGFVSYLSTYREDYWNSIRIKINVHNAQFAHSTWKTLQISEGQIAKGRAHIEHAIQSRLPSYADARLLRAKEGAVEVSNRGARQSYSVSQDETKDPARGDPLCTRRKSSSSCCIL